MKRTCALLLALMLLLALAPAVLADVIWIPEDPFLNKHLGDCSQHTAATTPPDRTVRSERAHV